MPEWQTLDGTNPYKPVRRICHHETKWIFPCRVVRRLCDYRCPGGDPPRWGMRGEEAGAGQLGERVAGHGNIYPRRLVEVVSHRRSGGVLTAPVSHGRPGLGASGHSRVS